MLESLFNKVAGQACNFIKKRLQHRCFPVKIVKLVRTPILKNTCERLLLYPPVFGNGTEMKIQILEQSQDFLKTKFRWRLFTRYFSNILDSFKLIHFNPVLHFIQKPVVWWPEQIKWLVSIWNSTLDWNRLMFESLKSHSFRCIT